MDVDELRNRFGSALRLDEIFQRRPELEKRPRRLKLTRSRDVDHLSPRTWKGELTAESCNLRTCWLKGVAEAQAILNEHACRVDFSQMFARRGFDLMRPKGGKYPGVSAEVDRSVGDIAEISEDITSVDHSDIASILAFDAEAALAEERKCMQTSTCDSHSLWINLDGDGGKKGHKKTILRMFTEPGLDVDDHASHDRLRRVRYFSQNTTSWDPSRGPRHDKSAHNEHLFKLGGLFATLISSNNAVALVIMQSTVIKMANAAYSDTAPIAELSLPDSRYEITGQILQLSAFFNNSMDLMWAWNGSFVVFDSAKAKRTNTINPTARMRHLNLVVHGSLVFPLPHDDLSSVLTANLPEAIGAMPQSLKTTWILSNKSLNSFTSVLQHRIKNTDVQARIPVHGKAISGIFPYEALVPNGMFKSHSSFIICSICSKRQTRSYTSFTA